MPSKLSPNDSRYFDLVEPVENPRRPRYKCKICTNKPEIYASTLRAHISLESHQKQLDPAERLPGKGAPRTPTLPKVITTYSKKGSKTSPIVIELDVELERKKKEATEAKKREEIRNKAATTTAEGLKRKRTATQAERGYTTCVEKAEELMKAELEKRGDTTHDYGHVNRVRYPALRIAKSLLVGGTVIDLKLVELAAILYQMATELPKPTDLTITLAPFLNHPATLLALSWDQKLKLQAILPVVSFAAEKTIRDNDQWSPDYDDCIELQIVQDAEKLESMGMMGLMRYLLSSDVRGRMAVGEGSEEGKGTADEMFMARSHVLKAALKFNAGKEQAESYEPSLRVWRAEIQKANEMGRGRQVSPD